MKNLKYLLILLVLVIIVPTDVFGLSSNNKHILTIEEARINNSTITFRGYSFISHMDNWGVDSTGYGNIKTYVVAYVRNKESEIFVNKTVSDGYVIKTLNLATCEGNSNCYYKVADVIEDRSFFYSRCTDDGCRLYDKIKTDRRTRGFINNNSCHLGDHDTIQLYDKNGNLSSSKYDNECLYENVGFSVTVDVQSVVDRFSEGDFRFNYGVDGDAADDIVFKIVVVNTATGDNIASGFNIHQDVCFVNGSKCASNNVTSASYNYALSDFATSVYFDAGLSIPTTYDSTKGFSNLPNYYFAKNYDYYLKSYYSRLDKSKNYSTCTGVDNYCGSYTDAFVELYTKKGNDGYLYPDGISSTQSYLAPANHVTLIGEFAINSFNVLAEPLDCDDIRNISGDNYSEKSIKCGNDADFSQCSVSGKNGNSIIGEMYYLDENYNPECSGTNYVEDANGNHYLKVKVMADVLIYQTGKFQFGTFSPNSVKAGKGFSIGNSGISYSNSVGFVIAGKYTNSSDSVFYNTPFINYSAVKQKKVTLGGRTICGFDTSFSIDEKIREYYSEYDSNGNPMKNNSPFYYKECESETKCVFKQENSLAAAIYAISDAFFKDKVVNYDNNKNNDTEMNDIFKFKSCDSNSSNIYCSDTDKVSVDGIWTRTEYKSGWTRLDALNNLYYNDDAISPYDNQKYRGYGKKFESIYTYNLPYAYVSLSDMNYANNDYNYADIVYTTSPVSEPLNANLQYVGNKYFVGFKYVYDNNNGFDFPFDLTKSDISFVSDMNWHLSGTCGVEVEDGYYKCDDPGGCDGSGGAGGKTKLSYKYRSISVNNAFPKFSDSNYVNAAANWKNWYWNSDITVRQRNRNRLKKTYDDTNLDYSITFLKSDISDLKVDISDIVNCSRNGTCSNGYGSMANFGEVGSPQMSKFVNKFFQIKPAANKYCGLGLFSTSCDGYTEEIQGGFAPIISKDVGSDISLQGDGGTISSYDEEVIS